MTVGPKEKGCTEIFDYIQEIAFITRNRLKPILNPCRMLRIVSIHELLLSSKLDGYHIINT
jgi:hypothetical protein